MTASVAAPQAAAAASKGGSKGELFEFDNSAVVFIDYQPEMLAEVRSMDQKLMMVNARSLARLAVKMGMPVVLSTVGVKGGVNHPTLPELRAEIPDVPEIDRNTMNAWDDDAFRRAVLKTGRRRFVMLGLWTEICLAFPIADMQAEGLRTTFPADAVGGTSKEVHDLAVQRMIQAGSVPNSTFAYIAESGLDWASPQGEIMREIYTWRQAELEKLNLA
ncbi:isochorismatase family protein [Streptomyces bullii]|uniref:Isochorismatase family protein n=1 Tax=Streptomyces bullii TaxID=349910 RepID=A0ABW0V2K6_9ACTN